MLVSATECSFYDHYTERLYTAERREYWLHVYVITVQQVEGLSGGDDGGTYFVDQSGQYYYQANSDEAPVMTQVQIQEVEESDVQTEGELTQINTPQDEQYQEIEELENTEGDEDVSRGHYSTSGISKYIFYV